MNKSSYQSKPRIERVKAGAAHQDANEFAKSPLNLVNPLDSRRKELLQRRQ
jgi:hypothetical protein